MSKTAIFAGTFNPFTVGHADIVSRGLELFDKIIICIGVNAVKEESTEAANARAEAIRTVYAGNLHVEVAVWHGLTADFAKNNNARFLLRSVRSVKDYEYERDMADANKAVFGLETVILFANPSLSYVSSSLVRELASYGQDVSSFLPSPC